MSNKKPNIVFLLNDHQVYYRHGWDNGPRIMRPNFEKLAAEGCSFERAYTACPLCGPARRTMLTGLMPHNHGEIKNDTEYPFDRETYLNILADNGYKNYYYGKWHAGSGTAYDHQCEGFSYPSYNNPYTKPEYAEYLKRYNLPEPMIRVERSFNRKVLNAIQDGGLYKQDGRWCNEHASGIMVTPKETHESFFLANLACEKLRELAKSTADKPFSLRVDFWGPHQPYFPTQEFADMYRPEDIPEYGNFRDDLKNKPDVYYREANLGITDGNRRLVIPNPLPWSEWQKVLARAYAQVTLVDAAGGLILDTLEELGLAENTIVIWTTDHGDALACHGGHFDKRSYMPEEVIRIPMAIRYPGVVAPGQKSKKLVSNLDVAPTILDAAGLSFNEEVDGSSLLPICTGNSDDWREEVVCETHGHAEEHFGRSLVTEHYKYTYNKDQLDELYNLESDPYELNNLIDSPDYQDIIAKMKEKLAAWQLKTGDQNPV